MRVRKPPKAKGGDQNAYGSEGPTAWGPAPFWSPLLDANINPTTRKDYRRALGAFVTFVERWDGVGAIQNPADLGYWLAFYAHDAYTRGVPKKYMVQRALFACEFWCPE